MVTSCTLLSLVPSVLCVQKVDMADAVEMYSDDLPSPKMMDQEMRRWWWWKMKWEPAKQHRVYQSLEHRQLRSVIPSRSPITHSCRSWHAHCLLHHASVRDLPAHSEGSTLSWGLQCLRKGYALLPHYNMDIDLDEAVTILLTSMQGSWRWKLLN